jgi:hypothetical protein
LNYEELKIVLLRAIEKRSLELEGRRVIQQAESGVSFHGLVGNSAMQKVYQSVEAGRATLKGEGANILFGWLFPCVLYTLGIGGPPYAAIPF